MKILSGLKYGFEEVDCCGCKVIKCKECPPPAGPKSICPTTRPAHCYTYDGTAHNQNITGCFVATCTENPSDAPPDEVLSHSHIHIYTSAYEKGLPGLPGKSRGSP